MKDSISLRFLYRTVIGRAILKLLINPAVSKPAGFLLSTRFSKLFIPHFIKKNNIDLTDIEIPFGGFVSFNDFFTRIRKSPVLKPAASQLISPCEGFLTPLEIRNDIILDIKNTSYSLSDLLKDDKLAEAFENGTALIFRLTPANYHRYCYSADGNIRRHEKISGKLHCVRPVALRTLPVFVQNSREYQLIESDNFGSIIQMEVGALMVGKISNYISEAQNQRVLAGEEKGYFEFGGSTIILLFQQGAVSIKKDLFDRKDAFDEIPVQIGEILADAGMFSQSITENTVSSPRSL